MTHDTPSGAKRPHPKDHVAEHAPYTGTTYWVLYLIAETAGHGLRFFGSIENVAKRAHMNRDSARRAFRQLETDGWLVSVKKSTGRAPSEYRLVLVEPADSAGDEPAAVMGVNPRIPSETDQGQPADLVAQPADLDAQPADLVVQPADLTPLTKEPSNTTTATERASRTYVPAIPDRPAIIQSAPDLAHLARSILAEERPEWTYTEPPARAARGAQRWLDVLAAAPDKRAALAAVEPTLRWAAQHAYWGGRLTSIEAIAKHWPDVVLDHRAQTKPKQPAMSAAQQQNLETIARVAQERASA